MLELEFRFDRFSKHLPDVSEPVLIILKAHLLTEEILEDLIEHHCRDFGVLNAIGLSFFVKTKLAQALIGSQLPNGLKLPTWHWEVIVALNELRNDLVHKLESDKLNQRIKKFLTLTKQELLEDDDSIEIGRRLQVAVSGMLGYLAAMEYIIRTGEIPEKRPT